MKWLNGCVLDFYQLVLVPCIHVVSVILAHRLAILN